MKDLLLSPAVTTLAAGCFLILFAYLVLALVPLLLRTAIWTGLIAAGVFGLVAALFFAGVLLFLEAVIRLGTAALRRFRKLLTQLRLTLTRNQVRP